MTSSQSAFITSVNETPANCWYTDNKGRTVTAEIRGMFPLQNMLGFPRALDHLDITWSVTALLNAAIDFLCCLHSLFKYSLVVYYTVVCSYNFYVVLTSAVMMCSGDEISFTGFFPYILNNAWVWWWSVHRSSLLTLEIAVLCFTVYWINISRVHCFCQTSADCRFMNICLWNTTLLQTLGGFQGLSAMPRCQRFCVASLAYHDELTCHGAFIESMVLCMIFRHGHYSAFW